MDEAQKAKLDQARERMSSQQAGVAEVSWSLLRGDD
jgi:hypothetical protein